MTCIGIGIEVTIEFYLYLTEGIREEKGDKINVSPVARIRLYSVELKIYFCGVVFLLETEETLLIIRKYRRQEQDILLFLSCTTLNEKACLHHIPFSIPILKESCKNIVLYVKFASLYIVNVLSLVCIFFFLQRCGSKKANYATGHQFWHHG